MYPDGEQYTQAGKLYTVVGKWRSYVVLKANYHPLEELVVYTPEDIADCMTKVSR